MNEKPFVRVLPLSPSRPQPRENEKIMEEHLDWSHHEPSAISFAMSLTDEEISTISVRLQNPLTGVKTMEGKWRSKKYSQCFSGQEGVKWILENSKAETIEEAEALGQRLMQIGTVRAITSSPIPFHNNPFLYQLQGRKELQDMDYIDEMVKEYMFYRGLMDSFNSFEKEIKLDRQSNHLNSSRIVQQILQHIQEYNLIALLDLWKYVDNTLFSRLPQKYFHTVEKLELGIKRYYVVYAVQNNRMDKVNDFFRVCSDQISNNTKWRKWFQIPFVKNPSKLPEFEVYFSKQWVENLSQSLTNFISTVLQLSPLPKILLYSAEKTIRKTLEMENQDLQNQIEKIKKSLSNSELEKMRDSLHSPRKSILSEFRQADSGSSSLNNNPNSQNDPGKPVLLGKQRRNTLGQEPSSSLVAPSKFITYLSSLNLANYTTSPLSSCKINSAVQCCKFSRRGDYIAIGTAERTVEVWAATGDLSKAKAVIFCFSDILSIGWDSNEDRILLCGTSNGRIKVWDAPQSQMVMDIKMNASHPRVTSICCSPNSNSFICSVCPLDTSPAYPSSLLMFYSLESMKVTKEISPDLAYEVHCVVINSSGTKVACAGNGGFISIYDMNTSSWNTWKGHEGTVCSIVFNKTSTALLSVGKDASMFQWNLSSVDKPALQYQYDHLNNNDISISLCPSNDFFIVNSSTFALVYQFNHVAPILRVDGNRSNIVGVDWHPLLNDVFLTASSDSLVNIHKFLPKTP